MSHARAGFFSALAAALLLTGCQRAAEQAPDDEALHRARAANPAHPPSAEQVAGKFYPKKIDDYFPGMDPLVVREAAPAFQLLDVKPAIAPPFAPAQLTESEIFGRNSWMIWSGGNDRFWDWLASNGFGFVDLLKLLDSRTRDTRFRDAGLINEPRMVQTGAPNPNALGVWIDAPADEEQRLWRENYFAGIFNGHTPAAANAGGVRFENSAAGNLRPFERRDRSAALSESGVPRKRDGAEKLGSEALLRRSELLQRSEIDPAFSRRDELRILPRIVHPAESAARSHEPRLAEHLGQHRRAISAHPRRVRQPAQARQPRLSHPRQPAAWHDRYLADRLGQH